MWMLDPRPNLPCIVQAVKDGFDLSEASNTPVMLQLRIRACHVHAAHTRHQSHCVAACQLPARKEKIEQRWPNAVKFIEERQLNEFFADGTDDVGLIVQGGGYNTVIRALEHLDMADVFGESKVPMYVMNVAYPLIESEIVRFCEGKRAVLVLEEGQPNFVEQNISDIVRRHNVDVTLHGKDLLPLAGEYNTATMLKGLRAFMEKYERIEPLPARKPRVIPMKVETVERPKAEQASLVEVEAAEVKPLGSLDENVHARPPGFCTGCPERPIFTALKLVERELGEHHVSADIGCHLFSILPPFNLGNTTMGYGLGGAGSAALNVDSDKRAISVMGDGGFWHNGLTSGIANAVFNRSDNLTIVIDNSYTAATGGQDILSSKAKNETRSTGHLIEKAARGVGVEWLRMIRRTYDLKTMTATLREALTTKEKGPKVLVAQSECMLNRQRREKGQVRKAVAAGERVVRERFGVDPDTFPRGDSVPSFYRAQVVSNPTGWDKFREKTRRGFIGWLQRRDAARRERLAF
uniref:2-hydroxyacyl-CoA lyase n=1 Tax=Panagrolaimus superbus TaxID=310955 RepID=A0A914YL50_9BILA